MIKVGDVLGKYEIQKYIGKGKFAKVYRAKDTVLDDIVAIKEIEMDAGKEDDAKKALREAILMRSLKNQHILSIWDAMLQNEYVYLVMEYASGGTLRDLLKEKVNLPEEQVIDIIKQICF